MERARLHEVALDRAAREQELLRADLFGHKGRRWLAAQELPPVERATATALLRQLDFTARSCG